MIKEMFILQCTPYVVLYSATSSLPPEVDKKIKKQSLECTEADSACFFAEAESKNPGFWRSGGGDRFLCNFHVKFKLIIGKFYEITWNMRFADTALSNFSMLKGLFLHLFCITVDA